MTPTDPLSPAAAGLSFRSSAVARLAQMPVATLRIWEQRHQAVRPATGPAGHRLYSAADVRRVLLLRQLTEQGHAIGTIASLPMAQLQALAGTASRLAPKAARRTAPLRLLVVGPALALRLHRPAVALALGGALRVVAVFESPAAAEAGAAATPADLVLWHAPELQATAPGALLALRQACGAAAAAVVYRFAGAGARQPLAEAGLEVLREPADDTALGGWLQQLSRPAPPAELASRPGPAIGAGTDGIPPRRFDDAELTALAGISPTLACECPRHVAELLMQLSSFETYSAGCRHRDSADAELHAYLQQVAGRARAMFEDALEQVARAEGLPLR